MRPALLERQWCKNRPSKKLARSATAEFRASTWSGGILE